jgi:hypothetical protein
MGSFTREASPKSVVRSWIPTETTPIPSVSQFIPARGDCSHRGLARPWISIHSTLKHPRRKNPRLARARTLPASTLQGSLRSPQAGRIVLRSSDLPMSPSDAHFVVQPRKPLRKAKAVRPAPLEAGEGRRRTSRDVPGRLGPTRETDAGSVPASRRPTGLLQPLLQQQEMDAEGPRPRVPPAISSASRSGGGMRPLSFRSSLHPAASNPQPDPAVRFSTSGCPLRRQ